MKEKSLGDVKFVITIFPKSKIIEDMLMLFMREKGPSSVTIATQVNTDILSGNYRYTDACNQNRCLLNKPY